VEILTPIAKGYVTDRAFEVCSQGMQVYGGYGFIEEYPMAQLLRDCRITMIYEGTNGIQAMDLLGRKFSLNKGMALMELFNEMHKTVSIAKNFPGLEKQSIEIEDAMDKLTKVAILMGRTAMSEKILNAFANAHPFLDVTGDVVMAWMLLWRAAIASKKFEDSKEPSRTDLVFNPGSVLDKDKNLSPGMPEVPHKKDKAFYKGILASLQFYVETQLPITLGKLNALMNVSSAAVDIDDKMFFS
jgi:hypothetical protein